MSIFSLKEKKKKNLITIWGKIFFIKKKKAKCIIFEHFSKLESDFYIYISQFPFLKEFSTVFWSRENTFYQRKDKIKAYNIYTVEDRLFSKQCKLVKNIVNYCRAKSESNDVLPSFSIPSDVQPGPHHRSNWMHYNTSYTSSMLR